VSVTTAKDILTSSSY